MENSTTTRTAAGLETLSGKYLTFSLGPEFYGVPVLQVREIIRLTAITPVPQMPAYIKGVINLRGKIIPVLDLAAKLGLASAGSSQRTCIVVVQVRAGAAQIQLGLLVDDVQEVAPVQASDLEAAPDFGAKVSTQYILGLAKLKNRVAILLDLDRSLTEEMLHLEPSTVPA